MIRFAGAMFLAALVVASCATPPTPSPSATAAPSPAHAPTPSTTPMPVESAVPSQDAPLVIARGWPITLPTELAGDDDPSLIGDTTLLVVGGPPDHKSQIVALDAGGFMKPGWPIEATAGAAFGRPVGSYDYSPGGGGVAIYVEECGTAAVGCLIHRLDDRGRATKSPGWPFRVPAEFACATPVCSDSLHVAPNLMVYLAHWREAGGLRLLAIDPAGQVRPGWPVPSGIAGGWWSDPLFDGDTVFMRWEPDGGVGTPSIAAFGPDGRLKTGWPVPVRGLVGYQLGSGGRVTAWSWEDVSEGDLCASPGRTVFTVIGPDGRTLPGWPRGSTGLASSPVTWGDSVRYVSATGKVYDHGLSGEVTDGWPFVVPGALRSGCGPAPPYVTPNGATFVLGDEINSLTSEGRQRTGWPYHPEGTLVLPTRSADTDGFPSYVTPAFLGNSTVFLVMSIDAPAGPRLEVIALDERVQLAGAWPYLLPIDPATATVDWFTVSQDGRLFIRTGATLLVLTGQGQIAR